jgi:predicted esterase
MKRIRVSYFLLLSAMLLLASCNVSENSQPKSQAVGSVQQDVSSPGSAAPKNSKPVPPLALDEPPELPGKLNDIDFANMEPDELFVMGRAAAAREIYKAAAIAQYWYFRKTGRGHYDVACYLARSGETDPAFYWLQKAGIEEGVDTQHAQRDPDLESLRSDARWKQVLNYLEECNRYFETADIAQTVLILPKDYKKPAAIPAIVWMHGIGSRPNDFVDAEGQEFADQLNVAVIGVSGTKPRGPKSFVWAEDVESDAKRIRAALAEVSDRVSIEKGKVITFGFSQGAQVGLEIAAQFPEEFAGSIVLSPGADSHLQSIKPSSLLAHRGFVISCGAEEHPGNVFLAKSANDWLRRANAQVKYVPYPGVSAHSFPADFDERFPEWVKFILEVK